MKYNISQKFLTKGTKRRSGNLADAIKFIVAHDTGNPNSTARNNVKYFENTNNESYSSAHFFVDDVEIIECIPAVNGNTEKASHVKRNRKEDNLLFGVDANDASIGVEYCYGSQINATTAYKKYVWLIAYLCYYFKLNPSIFVLGHFVLDYDDRTDPLTGLAHSGRDYGYLLKDIVEEYNFCKDNPMEDFGFIAEIGFKLTSSRLNIRKHAPTTKSSKVKTVSTGVELEIVGYVTKGQKIRGNSLWYKMPDGNFFWSGGVE